MHDIFRIRVKTKTGEIELEGSQLFVEKKMEKLPALIKKMDHVLAGTNISTTNKKTISENKTKAVAQASNKNKPASSKNSAHGKHMIVPHTFRLWHAKFTSKLRQADVLLIACYFVQHRSPDNIFKDFLAKNTLDRFGIPITNLDASITRLINEQLILVSKKMGKLTLYKVSTKGRENLEELIKKE